MVFRGFNTRVPNTKSNTPLVLTKTNGCEKGAEFFLIFFKGREDILQCFPSETRKRFFKLFEFLDSSSKDTFTLGVTDSSVESLNTKLVI